MLLLLLLLLLPPLLLPLEYEGGARYGRLPLSLSMATLTEVLSPDIKCDRRGGETYHPNAAGSSSRHIHAIWQSRWLPALSASSSQHSGEVASVPFMLRNRKLFIA